MKRRPTLTLKRKRLPEPRPGEDTLAELLDQPSAADPHNPHKLVQPSKAVVPDLERLKEILSVFERHATGAKDLSPRLADALKMEGSSLLAKVGNAASDNATDRD